MPLIDVTLADQAALLPWPNASGRFAPQGVFKIETAQPFWAQCLADGSILAAPVAPPEDAVLPADDKPAGKTGGKA